MLEVQTQEMAFRADANLRAGCDMASLQASPEGLPIYERMSFQKVDYYRTFVLKET